MLINLVALLKLINRISRKKKKISAKHNEWLSYYSINEYNLNLPKFLHLFRLFLYKKTTKKLQKKISDRNVWYVVSRERRSEKSQIIKLDHSKWFGLWIFMRACKTWSTFNLYLWSHSVSSQNRSIKFLESIFLADQNKFEDVKISITGDNKNYNLAIKWYK